MCDTFFSRKTKNGNGLFAKNSDREPLEAQAIDYHPARHTTERELQCTFIRIPQVAYTHSIIISRPFQMWGAEMGANEHGLVVGNEAVFTKQKLKKNNQGLTGMDMLRLALERCRTAKEAINLIIDLLETYSQNACGGYKNRDFYYSNSFLVADPFNAYVLETAGRFWAFQKVETTYAISNALTIGQEYEDTNAKLLHKNGFAATYSDFLYTSLGRAKQRRSCTSAALQAPMDVLIAMTALRQHHLPDTHFHPRKANTGSICMHATSIFNPSSTVGSMVVELFHAKPPVVWLTGTPYACQSIFKPFFFHELSCLTRPECTPGPSPDDSLWWRGQQRYLAQLKPQKAAHYAEHYKYRDTLQEKIRLAADDSTLKPVAIEHMALDEIEPAWTSCLLLDEKCTFP